MLGRIIRTPVLLFLRHEAWTIDVAVREKRGWFDQTTAIIVMALIMPWSVLAMILMLAGLVILPWLSGVDDDLISIYFPVISMAMLIPIWMWGAHWMVIIFAQKFGYPGMAKFKQERAHLRLAWWRGLGLK